MRSAAAFGPQPARDGQFRRPAQLQRRQVRPARCRQEVPAIGHDLAGVGRVLDPLQVESASDRASRTGPPRHNQIELEPTVDVEHPPPVLERQAPRHVGLVQVQLADACAAFVGMKGGGQQHPDRPVRRHKLHGAFGEQAEQVQAAGGGLAVQADPLVPV